MFKTLDYVTINLILMLLAFVWTYFLVKNIWFAIIISLLIYLFVWATIKVIKKRKNKYNSQTLLKHLALMGQAYSVNLIFDNLNYENKRIAEDKYIIIDDKKELIYPMFKFSSVGYENIATIYQIAIKNKIKKVYLISGSIDKNAMMLANALNVKIEYVNIDYIYNKLKKENKLPPLIEQESKPISKINLKAIIKHLLSPNNTKYYIFSGILFALISFITINKSYYVILSTITLILAIFTLLPYSNELFNPTTNETIYKTDFDNKYLNKSITEIKKRDNKKDKK